MADRLTKQIQSFERLEEEQATQSLAEQLKLGYIDLVDYQLLPDALTLIAEAEAAEHHVVAYLKVGSILHVASDRPTSVDLPTFLKQLANRTKHRVALAVCSPTSFRAALAAYRAVPSQAAAILKEALEPGGSVAEAAERVPTYAAGLASIGALVERIRQVSTSELLEVLFSGALAMNATDIHLEPAASELRVRFRIDGVLQEIVRLPREAFQAVRSRVKYLAKLKLDVAHLPQDGRFEFRMTDRQVDVRVSSLPGLYGEIITLRLLPHNRDFMTLEALGFSREQLATIETAMHRPHGMILATGPTGSGKTTTLYAMLAKLNQPDVKIMTLEDPIEYRLPGIDQSQVASTGEYTFAAALRSAIRQDPNILMVGEIRDSETATTAVQAALTGHLVLSTLHTNDAPGAIPRLLEMGVKPFLLSGVINLIIAQRLVRRICPACGGRGLNQAGGRRQEAGVSFSSRSASGASDIGNPGIHGSPIRSGRRGDLPVEDDNQGIGCDQCHGTGYKGRVAIAELLVPSRAIEELIIEQGSAAAFAEAAKQAGMVDMATDGYAKVRAGLTTAAEVERVTGVAPPAAADH